MKIIIDNQDNAIILNVNNINRITSIHESHKFIHFNIHFNDGTVHNMTFCYDSYLDEKQILINKVKKIRQDIIYYLNNNIEPENIIMSIKKITNENN